MRLHVLSELVLKDEGKRKEKEKRKKERNEVCQKATFV
jgi:hypothetical protein